MTNTPAKKIRVTLVKSASHRIKKHKACINGLGLKRTGQSIILNDTPEIRGMINQVNYLLMMEEI